LSKKQDNFNPRIVNRRARHDYNIHESFEVGVVLRGSEVKSVRNGQVSLAEGFAKLETRPKLELWLYNVDIAPYPHAPPDAHAPKRARKLLVHKHQLRKLAGETSSKGQTLVPLTMYFVRGRAKVEIGLASGKQKADKRQDNKRKESDKEIRRAMTRKVIR